MGDLASDRTGGKVPPPVFDGDLDAAVPGSNGDLIPNSVTGIVTDGKLSFLAGALQGFHVGARLALHAPGQPKYVVGPPDLERATAVTAQPPASGCGAGADGHDIR